MPTHPVAHEGNPRTDSITIEGGNLITEATLTVTLPSAVSTPPPSVTPPILATGGTTSCVDVFSWNSDREDPLKDGLTREYLEAQSWSGVSDGNGNKSPQRQPYHDPTLLMHIHTAPDCYGVIYYELERPEATEPGAPVGRTYMQAQFLGLISGTPRAGIATFIQDPNRHPDDITVAAIVTDWAAGTTGLYYWRGGSLRNFEDATPLAVTSFLPDEGYSYRILRDYDANTPRNFVRGQVLDADHSIVWWSEDDGNITLPLSEAHITTAGFIAVGGHEGRVEFGGNGATSYPSGSPHRIRMYWDTWS